MNSENIIKTLGDKYNIEILSATSDPKSANDLSDDLGVPIATCYRRIKDLTENDLLELYDRPLSEDHRRVKVYRRNVDGIEINFEDGISIDISEREVVKNKLDDVWRTMPTQ